MNYWLYWAEPGLVTNHPVSEEFKNKMSALEQSKFPQSVKWSSWNLSTLWKLALNMLASHQSHPVNRSNRAFLSLARFCCTGQSLGMNRVKSLLSMCCILLGYSFESRPNSRAVGTAGSVLIIGLSRKNQFDARKQDWLVQKFGLGDFKGLTSMWFRQGLLLFSSVKKTKEGSRRVHLSARSTILSWLFFFSSLFLRSLYILSSCQSISLGTMYKVCV